MTSPDSNLPDDDARDVEAITNADRLRVTLEIAVAALILAAIYYIFAPEEDIDLPAPLEESQIDPIIHAQIESSANQTTPSEDKAVATEEAAHIDSPSQLEHSVEETEPADIAAIEGGGARALIARLRAGETDFNPDQVLNQITIYQNEGKTTDAYLLLFFAAREGDATAAFSLASMHDPNHFTKGNPLLEKPDAYQAHKWYSAAAEKGIPKANERLRRLKQTTEKKAKKGDLAAKRLLLNWQ
jgi:TPR repeat protein